LVHHCPESEYFSNIVVCAGSTAGWGRFTPTCLPGALPEALTGRTVGAEPERWEAEPGVAEGRASVPTDSVAIVRRLFEAFDAVDLNAMDELLSEDFVAHGLSPQFSDDTAGWKALAQHWATGFSEEELTLEDFVAEGDKVAVRFTSRANHVGEVFGIAPTDRRVTITGIDIYRLNGGKVAEYWGELNLRDLH